MKKSLIALGIMLTVSANASWALCSKMDVELADLKWKEALDSNKAKNVADLYAKKAVLVPTFNEEILTTPKQRFDYFAGLFDKIDNLRVHFYPDKHIQIGDGGAVSSGFYVFAGTQEGHHHRQSTLARYTFVYKEIEKDTLHHCKLKLITHHSSEQPDSHLALISGKVAP